MGKKHYFYDFQGRIFLNAEDQDQAEQLVTDIPLADFLVHEDIYRIDEHYIPFDLKKRDEKNHTYLHPIDDAEEYEKFRKRVRRYGYTIKKFLHGKIDKEKLMKQLE